MEATPYLMITPVIRNCVEEGRIGVYILGNCENGKFAPKYVGRSDYDLRRRLLTHNHFKDYDYFIFRYANSVKECFYSEARLWHDLKDDIPDFGNLIHPNSPSGTDLKCPYCEFINITNSFLCDAG